MGLCLWGADKYEIKRQIREIYKLLDNPKSTCLTFFFAK
nr:hypothetical protein [Prevotella aurantiaca]